MSLNELVEHPDESLAGGDVELAVAVTPTLDKKSAKKRPRTKKVAPAIAGPGVVVLGERFVCSYSGEFSERAIFVPGLDDACFRNLPCAFAFLEESGADAQVIADFKKALCESYEQPEELVERAPSRSQLANFGGDKFYDEWIGGLELWDRLTETSGLNVAQYKQRGVGKRTAVARGKGSDARISFDAAAYCVGYGKGASGCRLVNALDASGPVEEGEVRDSKKTLTIVRATRKLQKFIKSHAQYACTRHYGTSDFQLLFVDCKQDTDKKFFNHVASQLIGNNVFGPVVVIFLRKFSLKV